jgi:signal transduction histidine kinase
MISVLYPDRQGRLWVGTRRDGLISYQGEHSATTYGKANGLSSLNVFAVTEDRQGVLWAGTEAGLCRLTNGQFVAVDLPVTTEQAQPVIRSLHAARDGSLWIGTQNGLYHLSAETTNYYGQPQGFPAALVYYITEDRAGRLWLGTAQGIVCRWDGVWRHYKPSQNFPTYHVYWLALDEQGFLWYTTPWTIFRVETALLLAHWRGEQPLPIPLMFTQSDGLLSMECLGGRQSPGCQTSDSRLIFPTRRGLAVADPRNLSSTFTPPRVVIERIRVNGRDYPVAPVVELPPGSRVLEIDFAGLSFRQPEKVRHRYLLSGVDAGWIEAYHRRTATYANLGPGRFEFRVTADDGHGQWSAAGAGVELIIHPYFYQTTWFYVALLGLTTAGIYGGYRWRVRLLKRRNALLTARLTERTRELEQVMAERLRLEQAALARKQQETIGQMAAGTAHHLNNQLQAIQSSAALLQDESNTPAEMRGHFAYIEEAIGKSARIVAQLLAFGQRHWLRMETLDLRQFIPAHLAHYPPGRVRVTWKGEVPPIKADAHMLEQALTTVLDNALQASPAGALVEMEIQPVLRSPPPPVSPAAPQPSPPQPFVQIQIKDKGQGLSEKAQAHLFEPFFTTKDIGQGTGMGLAAAYGGMKQIGGWIEVFNSPEGGCTANLFLPVAD